LLHAMREMQRSSADVEALMLITGDGKYLMSSLPGAIGDDQLNQIAAMLAASAALASDIADAITPRQGMRYLCLQCQRGYTIVLPLYDGMSLVVLAREQAKLGLIYMDFVYNFLALAGELIRPPRPPKNLTARAKPEYHDDDPL
jgi:predicted regulator of Ras-like GTPase activity (Roadblock/LC7/MglB family)